MNRAISGTIVTSGSGRPLPGLQVVAVQLIDAEAVVLGAVISGDLGRFRVAYDPLPGPADLCLIIFSASGELLFTEPVHRRISGAELRLQVEVPRLALREDLH